MVGVYLAMINIIKVLDELEIKLSKLKEKLENRRREMVDQDCPNISAGITATRWLVEQDIESLDKELVRLENGIKEVKKLSKIKNRYFSKYFVTDSFEYLSLGIISQKTSLGKDILEWNIKKNNRRQIR